jgi:hypothetical protein
LAPILIDFSRRVRNDHVSTDGAVPGASGNCRDCTPRRTTEDGPDCPQNHDPKHGTAIYLCQHHQVRPSFLFEVPDDEKLARLSWEFDQRPGNIDPRLCDGLLAVNGIT